MPNRAQRRGSGRNGPRRYRAPLGLDYNEFVGPLGPPQGNVYPELQVRYGVKDNLYLDWSITLMLRTGSVEDFRRTKEELPRKRWQRIEVSNSAVRHYGYSLDDPHRTPEGKVIRELSAGDHTVVDATYVQQMKGLRTRWVGNHGHDPHADLTFQYALRNHDPEFRNSEAVAWVRNTVISLHSDQADEAIVDRAAAYFAGRPSTAGVLLPDGIMKFIHVNEGKNPNSTGGDEPFKAGGQLTMGMLVSSVYSPGWIDRVEDFLEDQ